MFFDKERIKDQMFYIRWKLGLLKEVLLELPRIVLIIYILGILYVGYLVINISTFLIYLDTENLC